MSPARIPFVDLRAEYEHSRAAIDRALRGVVESSVFIGGEEVCAFEREMALHQGVDEVVSCASGTDALALALRALGVGPGDEVVTTPCTAIPTSEAVTLASARPVFAEVDPRTGGLDPAAAEEAITPRTKAILPVHLYGMPCDLDAFAGLARRRGLLLVEDCAQAQGARWREKRVGTVGDAAGFSFFPSKNLGAFGDGGAMTARESEVRSLMRRLANHGRASKLEHAIEGTNSRLDAIQAAVLRVKLTVLDERNHLRRRAAAWYAEELSGVKGLRFLQTPEGAEPVWHLFPVFVADRDGLAAHLRERGIETGIHYAMALHLQPAYAWMKRPRGSLPQAEEAFDRELSLPFYPSIERDTVAEVAGAIRDFLAR